MKKGTQARMGRTEGRRQGRGEEGRAAVIDNDRYDKFSNIGKDL